jgi:hypothetical protein
LGIGSGLSSLRIDRKLIQLQEHLNWILWAVAKYYFQNILGTVTLAQKAALTIPLPSDPKWYFSFSFSLNKL